MKNLILFLLFTLNCFAQKTIQEVLVKYNKNLVPYISVNELKEKQNIILFDSRDATEYKVSHLKNANYVGFDDFDSKKIKEKFTNPNATIIVYCSIGVRSEIIGKKLLKMGYKNVFNLYGGIFEWSNQNLPVYDSDDKQTQNVHAFSKEWSQYLKKGNKVY